MLRINGQWVCVAEYLDRCIGQRRIVDVMQRGETFYYVFENGYALPLLCYCCGESLVIKDLEQARRDMVGRRLESMSTGPVTLQDGSEITQFCLELSKKGLLSRGVSTAVAIEAAVRMHHPADCPYRDRSKSPAKKRRRR